MHIHLPDPSHERSTLDFLYMLRRRHLIQPVTPRTQWGAWTQQGVSWGILLGILLIGGMHSLPLAGLLGILIGWNNLAPITLCPAVLSPACRWASWQAAHRLGLCAPSDTALWHLECWAAGVLIRSEDAILIYCATGHIAGVAIGGAILQGWGIVAWFLIGALVVCEGLAWGHQRAARRAYILFLAVGYYRQAIGSPAA